MASERARVRRFFAAKAAGWEKRFPDDNPAYEAAIAELGLTAGQVALDAGCGTGRALPALREAVGPDGTVIGTDLTPEMLHEAVRAGRHRVAALVEADAERLPLRDAVLDGVFAAGLVHHLTDPAAGLRELARATGAGGRLVLFHPIGRAALAARHGHPLSDDDIRAEPNLRPLLAASGWRLTLFADEPDRYLALAVRTA